MAAADAEEHLIDLIDAAIARVAEHARNDRDCALLIAELEAVKHRVQNKPNPSQAGRLLADQSGRQQRGRLPAG